MNMSPGSTCSVGMLPYIIKSNLPLWPCFVLEIIRLKLQGNRSAWLKLTRMSVVSRETKRAIWTQQQQLVFNHPEPLKLIFATPDKMFFLSYEALANIPQKCTSKYLGTVS